MRYEDEKELKVAFAEVCCILKKLPQEFVEKIPPLLIEIMKDNADKFHKYTYDNTKDLDEQDITEETKALLAIIYKSYIREEA